MSTNESLERRIARLENDQQQVRGIEKRLSVLANTIRLSSSAIAKLEARVASLNEKIEQLDKKMWRHIDPEWE